MSNYVVFFRLFGRQFNKPQINKIMRAPFSSLAKQVLASSDSATELRRFLSSRDKKSEIIIIENGKRKVIRAEKFDDIAINP
jgi:hypothetical protein